MSRRTGRTLQIPKVKGVSSSVKTLRRETIQFEGVRLMNCIPREIRNFIGNLDTFKKLLDSFQCLIPDQLETEILKPEVTDCEESPSNYIND